MQTVVRSSDGDTLRACTDLRTLRVVPEGERSNEQCRVAQRRKGKMSVRPPSQPRQLQSSDLGLDCTHDCELDGHASC